MTAATATPTAKTARKPAKPRRARAKSAPDAAVNPLCEGRDSDGRFTKGNAGGVGNPYARQVAILRRELIQTTTPDDIRRLGLKLKDIAMSGNVQAMKLLFSYTLGLPTQPGSPDDIDIDEVLFLHRDATVAAMVKSFNVTSGGCQPEIIPMRFNRSLWAYRANRTNAAMMTATPEERKHHAAVTADLPPNQRYIAWGNYGAAKDAPKFEDSPFHGLDWVAWPAAKEATDEAPSTTGSNGAPAQAPTTAAATPSPNGTPSTSGVNGAHAQSPAPAATPSTNGSRSPHGSNGAHPKLNHEKTKGRKHEANVPVNRLKGKPSTNRTIGARSKYALLPKSMRPKGVIVPGF